MVKSLRLGQTSNGPRNPAKGHAVVRLWTNIRLWQICGWQVAAIWAVLAGAMVVEPASVAAGPRPEPLQLIRTITLPDLPGRIDHLAIDLKGHRLFLAALEKNTIEVVDLKAGKVSRSLTGFNKPQGVFYLATLNRLFVASGKDGAVRSFDGPTLNPSVGATVSLGADAIGYDPTRNQIYVGSGGSDAGKERGDLTIFDAASLRQIAALTTDAHAGGSIAERRGRRMFVLVPEKGQVLVLDRTTRAVLATWTVPGIEKDVAIALDEKTHRLFLGVRTPASIVVLNADSGALIASVPTVGTLDGLSFDAVTRRIYTTGGEGFLDVTQQVDADHYERIARIPTGPVARTSLFVPEWKQLFVAVPRDKARGAELRVFEAIP
jgi:DNA-binding beta-propeller fold protein YncE